MESDSGSLEPCPQMVTIFYFFLRYACVSLSSQPGCWLWGCFLNTPSLSFLSQFLQIQPTGPKKCRRKNYVSSLHSRTLVAPARTLLASLLFSFLPSSLLKVLPLRGPGRSDQSPLVPLLVLFVPSPHSPGQGQSLRW